MKSDLNTLIINPLLNLFTAYPSSFSQCLTAIYSTQWVEDPPYLAKNNGVCTVVHSQVPMGRQDLTPAILPRPTDLTRRVGNRVNKQPRFLRPFPSFSFFPSSSSPSTASKPDPNLPSPSPIPSNLIMNSIAQLAARSARLNGASAMRQANPIARRAFTNGKIRPQLPSPAKQAQQLIDSRAQAHRSQSLDSSRTQAS